MLFDIKPPETSLWAQMKYNSNIFFVLSYEAYYLLLLLYFMLIYGSIDNWLKIK